MPIAAAVLAAGGFLAVPGAVWAQPEPLSIDDAVRTALTEDPRVESASWDWLAASAKAEAAAWRRLPSLSAGASYQRLSELPGSSFSFGASTVTLPAALPDVWTFSLNLQYPVFAGFRISEAAALADLTAQNKAIALEMVKRSLVFEVRRAYWEAVRAAANAQTLRKNLELVAYSQKLMQDQIGLGTVTQADLLNADLRVKQATMDLADAVSLQKRVNLTLASLLGKNSAALSLDPTATDALELFSLTSRPEGQEPLDPGPTPDAKAVIEQALRRRPETRIGQTGILMAEHSARLARAGLYPTLSITGSYLLGDPNPRTPFQTDPTIFTGTWALGVQLSYDLGGLPANINESISADHGLSRARSEAAKARQAVILDVQSCILAYNRARLDLDLVTGMVGQARENVRVMTQRKNAGSANTLDTLTAQLALLRAEFAVTNKEIDRRIAAADLARAAADDPAGDGSVEAREPPPAAEK